MKKIILAALFAITAGSVFANTIVINDENKPINNIEWKIHNRDEVVSINNASSSTINMFISVTREFYDGSYMWEDVVVNCNGKNISVKAGSSLICPIQSSSIATIQVPSEIFKHGSEGIYSVLPQ